MITLAQAKLATQDKIVAGVIDEFAKNNVLLDNMIFDDAVAPGGSGSTLTYGYTRVITQPTAAFRAINYDYEAQEAETQRYTVDLKVFGGSFEVDRIFANMGSLYNNVAFQLSQKIKATNALFNDAFINGDSGVDANAFDGIDKAITGSSTEYGADGYIDLSTTKKVDENYKAFLDALDEYLALLDGRPTMICGNSKLIAKIQQVARRAGYLSQIETAFGRKVNAYDGIPLVDLGAKAGSVNPIVAIESRTINESTVTGLTDLYTVRIGLDGVHAVSMAGQPLVNVWMPDFNTAGAVKKGEVEMVAGVAVKATKAAGAFRNLKVE